MRRGEVCVCVGVTHITDFRDGLWLAQSKKTRNYVVFFCGCLESALPPFYSCFLLDTEFFLWLFLTWGQCLVKNEELQLNLSLQFFFYSCL